MNIGLKRIANVQVLGLKTTAMSHLSGNTKGAMREIRRNILKSGEPLLVSVTLKGIYIRDQAIDTQGLFSRVRQAGRLAKSAGNKVEYLKSF